MKDEPRAILWLIAAGRISPAEAERLVTALSADRELLWLVVALAALVVFQGASHTSVVVQLAHALAPGWHWITQSAITSLGNGLGGLQ